MTWNRSEFIVMRKGLGMSQTEVGEWLGVSQKSICNWESGNFEPRTGTKQVLAQKIAQKVDLDVVFAVTGVRLPLSVLKSGEKWVAQPRKIVIVEFEGRTETYEYETSELLEHIAENLGWIKSIQVLECKSLIEVSNE